MILLRLQVIKLFPSYQPNATRPPEIALYKSYSKLFSANRCVRLEPHTAKRVIRVIRPFWAFSVVANNQYPGLVTLTHYHDRLGIEIAEINTDVLRVSAGLPQKPREGLAPCWNRSPKSPAMIR